MFSVRRIVGDKYIYVYVYIVIFKVFLFKMKDEGWFLIGLFIF